MKLGMSADGSIKLSEAKPGDVIIPVGCLIVDGAEVERQPFFLKINDNEMIDLANSSPLKRRGDLPVFLFQAEFTFDQIGGGTLLKNAKPGQAVKVIRHGTACKDLPYYLVCTVTPAKAGEVPLLNIKNGESKQDIENSPFTMEYFGPEEQVLIYNVSAELTKK